jgi:hypothetical protein
VDELYLRQNRTDLSSTNGAGSMKGDDLRADKVVSGSDVGGNFEEDLAAVGVHQVGTPLLRTLTVN